MFRRLSIVSVVAVLALSLAACHNKRASNPIANVDSKQPDKVLFDRAMDMVKHNKFDQARLTLQTLINTYPDSEFIARAKLGIADSWYAEGGSAAWAQAEAEYNDFRTFFPNMPEAAEAQMKIGNIHFQQMEKPDRDFTHAKRAEDAYRQMILEYPDSKLLPQAKERLRQVQEVLAEREFRIGRFYYLRESYPAAIARLKAVADTYPLYSGAEEALYMIGDSYEGEIRLIRDNKFLPEAKKGQLIKEWTDGAADAYSRIITRYPVTGRADDAKKRLAELKRPIPTPTPQAIAENKAEEASREKLGLWSRTMLNFHKRPDVAEATRVGEPTLVDPKTPDAPAMTRHVAEVVTGQPAGSLSVEKGTGVPGPNQPVPRSDQAAPADQSAPPAQTGSAAANSSATSAGSAQAGTSTSSVSVQGTANTDQSPAATGIGELTPMTSAPGTTATQTTPPQANPAAADSTNSTQAVTGETGTPAPGATESAPTAPAAGQNNAAPAAGSTNGAPATASPDQNGSAPAPPPAQVNDINSGSSSSTATAADTASQSTDKNKSDKDRKESSSKKKKKKFGVF